MAYEIVADAAGSGYYQLEIKNGATIHVPAVKGAPKDESAYVKERQRQGDLVIVYRAGERGMAAIQPNANLLQVEEMIYHHRDSFSSEMIDRFIQPGRFNDVHFVDVGNPQDPEYLQISGVRKANQAPFKARVVFQFSPL